MGCIIGFVSGNLFCNPMRIQQSYLTKQKENAAVVVTLTRKKI